MSYTNGLDNPELFFQCKLYTGTGSSHAITLDGSEDMQPDMVWWKERTSTDYHTIVDSVRGATKRIFPNATDAEDTNTESLKSFDSDGFTMGTNAGANQASQPYVAWNWKAGTSFSNDASATGVGDIDSSGSVNTDAGISICSFTGNGSNSQTVKHGLSTAPELIILKARGQGTYGWMTYDSVNGAGKYMNFAADHGAVSDTGMWSNTAPTSSVFSLSNGGNTAITNPNTVTMIAYCFHSVKSYSKISSFTGNGNADGTFVYTGFRPAWVIIKKSSGTNEWGVWDNKRSTSNVTDDIIYANLSNAEAANNANGLDFVSNGFKIRASGDLFNASGGTYIYMAFAESPFTNSNGVPTNAR